MGIIILVSIVIGLPLGFFLESYLLHVTTRIFKIEGSSYKKAMLVTIYSLLMFLVIAIAYGGLTVAIPAVKNKLILDTIATISSFFVSYYVFKKYYKTNIRQYLKIYILYAVFSGLVSIVFALGSVIIRTNIAQPFTVAGAAMSPNFKDGTYIFVKEYDKDYKRGDVVVFKYPKDETQFFIKRVIGLPGETVAVKQGIVYVNGSALDESAYLSKDIVTNGDMSLSLGTDQYFVMGDNRQFSSDSRAWGALNKNLITGKYWFEPGISMK